MLRHLRFVIFVLLSVSLPNVSASPSSERERSATPRGMTTRSKVTASFRGKDYVAEYEIKGGVLTVFFEGKSKSRRILGVETEFLAWKLLIEMIHETALK